MQPKTIALLGSTGSIGTQGIAVCESLGYRVAALTAHRNETLLAQQARRLKSSLAVISDQSRYSSLKTLLADTDVRVAAGPEGILEAAAFAGCDTVLNAIVGIAGLRPTLAAIEAGKDVALANKETLVAAGALVTGAVKQAGTSLLPVDSEHSAMLQCMAPQRRSEVRGVILTGSGGPFFGKRREELAQVTPKEALRHPNWRMGPKISVDCATLMNKGLEFIEAMWLFDLRPDQIQVVIHRQSVLHSAVEYQDGSVIAQLGAPDMRCAIQYALTCPAHLPLAVERLSLTAYGALTFEPPDMDTFRCLSACMDAARQGGLAPCVANGANEAAVALFLEGGISFPRIGDLVSEALEAVRFPAGIPSLNAVEEADCAARAFVAAKA